MEIKGLYGGPIPGGFVRIKPSDEVGTITIRASCIHGVFQAASSGAIINLEGEAEVEVVTLVTGIMGGKKFSFKVENPVEELMSQLDDASYTVVMEQMRQENREVLDPEDEKDKMKVN